MCLQVTCFNVNNFSLLYCNGTKLRCYYLYTHRTQCMLSEYVSETAAKKLGTTTKSAQTFQQPILLAHLLMELSLPVNLIIKTILRLAAVAFLQYRFTLTILKRLLLQKTLKSLFQIWSQILEEQLEFFLDCQP